jgi:glycosyltransferase involved in cell wall biosynthesis
MAEAAEVSRRVAVLVPCYNEATTIARVIEDFRRRIPRAAIYVFDNNSTDGTADIARSAGAVVIREKKQGKGHVVAAMLEKIDADYYLMVDGDDTYPADRTNDLLAPLLAEQADVVVGKREATDQTAAYRRFHVFGNWLVRSMINLIFGADLGDIMSGYRAFTREVAMNLPIIAYGFDIETEMTVQCLYRKWVIREVPVAYRSRPVGSESKLNTFHDGLRVLFRILNVFRSYKPLTFFGGMGILFFLMSGILAGWVWYSTWAPTSGYRLALIVLAAALLGMSLIAVSIGVIVQLINFRFLELDSVLRRTRAARRRGDLCAEDPAPPAVR